MDRRTVATWLEADGFPERCARAGRRRGTLLDPFLEYVEQRHRAGVQNAAALSRELRSRGYAGSDAAVRRALVALRRRDATDRLRAQSRESHGTRDGPGDPSKDVEGMVSTAVPLVPLIAWPPGAEAPTVRQAVWLLRKPDDALRPDEQDYVGLVCARIPALAEARRLALAFQGILKMRDGTALSPWLDEARRSELRSFVRGVERDRAAVLAAILSRWSNGQTEGQVNRVKAIKRAMYGRAKFDLLRKRILHHAA
jgi:transposase